MTVKTSKGGHSHAYPFNENNLKTGYGEERTHDQTFRFAAESTKKAAASGVPSGVCGVKGFSWFMFVPKFDIIRGSWYCVIVRVRVVLKRTDVGD